MQNHYTTPQELAALHKRGAQCLDGPVPGRWPGRSTARRSGSAALAVSCPICDTIVIMARTKRFQLTLQNGSKLSALKDWMERDIPVRLTLSQVADAAIEIVHKVATSTTSRIVHIPTFERGVQALILRGTVQTTSRIIAGFGMDVDIKANPRWQDRGDAPSGPEDSLRPSVQGRRAASKGSGATGGRTAKNSIEN